MDIDISWDQAWVQLVQLTIAWVLTLPVAWDREMESRSAGLRTFPLVAVAACGYTLVGISVLHAANAQARVEIGDADTYAECTRLTLVTTGAQGDSWGASSITATIREGTFTQEELEYGYLYVTNGDGCVNAEGFDMTEISGPEYTLTVTNGTGDGDYEEDEVVNIAADEPASGYVFDCWTGDTTNVADVDDPTTTITMPAANATITATYAEDSGEPEEITVYAQADTNLSQYYPNNNYATSQYLYATLLSNSGKSLRPMLQFDVSAVQSQVNSATLRIYSRGSNATVYACRMTNPAWSETKATWNNFDKDVPTAWTTAGGDFDNSVVASATTGAGPNFVGWVEIDVTDLVQDMVDNDQTTGSFLMYSDKTGTGTSGGDGTYVSIQAKEYSSGTYKAQLIVESQEEHSALTDRKRESVLCAGARALMLAPPVFGALWPLSASGV